MEIKYEIEEMTNAVKIFYGDAIVPSLYQPYFPNGDIWLDATEASAWAELYIASVIDNNAPYAPNARGEAGEQKSSAEKIAAIKAARQLLNNAENEEERDIAMQAIEAAKNLI